MILFKEDWGNYPSAIPHTSTTNTSWLHYVELLKSMGVENHAFPLAIHNPTLIGVDPFSPDLTVEQMVQIQLECKYNPWYFYREVLRIPPLASSEPLPMLANRGNISTWWLCYNHIDTGLTQPRQTGKSLTSDSINTHIKDVAGVNTTIILLTKDNTLRISNIDRLKKMRQYLPSYVGRISKHDADNKTEMTNKSLGNTFRTAVGQSNHIAAANLGRGLSAPITETDESPFIQFIDVTLPAMLAATRAARDEARRKDGFYFNLFPTTAGKKDSRSGRYMYDMFMGAMPWDESLFDCKNAEELQERVKKNSPGLKKMVYVNLLHHQLGKTDEWLFEAMSDTNSTGPAAERDFLNRWTSGTGGNPLPVDLVEIIGKSRKKATWVETFSEGYVVNWYVSQDELFNRAQRGIQMVGGMDTSDGLGRDQITMVITCSSSFEVLGCLAVNETNLILFSNWVTKFMLKYSNLILIPEKRSSGVMIIDNLLLQLPPRGIDPFKRIYNRVIDEGLWREDKNLQMVNEPLSRRTMAFYTKCKKYFGYSTSGSGYHSRDKLYEDTLQKAARIGGHVVNDTGLSQEITSLEVKDGRVDHSAGGHDDRVIGWLLAGFMLAFSKNLSHYGIIAPLAEAVDYKSLKDSKSETRYDSYQKYQQRKIKQEITQLLMQLKDVREELTAIFLEGKIRALNSNLTEEETLPVSIDSLIEEAQERRNMSRYK